MIITIPGWPIKATVPELFLLSPPYYMYIFAEPLGSGRVVVLIELIVILDIRYSKVSLFHISDTLGI